MSDRKEEILITVIDFDSQYFVRNGYREICGSSDQT